MLRGLYHAPDSFYGMRERDEFLRNYGETLKVLMARPDTRIVVACLAAEEDIILGYAVLGQDTLHYVYVKPAWRQQGIARALVSEVKQVTHIVPNLNKLRVRKGINFKPLKEI